MRARWAPDALRSPLRRPLCKKQSMNTGIYDYIRSWDVEVRRDHQWESQWSYEGYADQVNEALRHHVGKAFVSEYMKCQISRAMHQGYWAINDMAFASPVRIAFEAMENILDGGKHRGRLSSVSKELGFDVFHAHFAQSSCITQNWLNHASRTKLQETELTAEALHYSLMSSVSSKKRTGEWVVFSRNGDAFQFWCVWLHEAGDSDLVKVIRNQLA